MHQILIAYSSSDGQTSKVANFAADVIRGLGHRVDVAEVSTLTSAHMARDYDAAILGSSIHIGKHQASMVQFASDHAYWLNGRSTAFFSLSLASATNDEEHRSLANEYVDQFVEAAGWAPDRVWLIAGALPYQTYSFLKRQLMRHIVAGEGGDVDTSRNHEYTDWKELERMVVKFMNGVLDTSFAGTASI